MSKKDMQHWRCNVHNVDFTIERTEKLKPPVARCPYCAQEEITRLREARDELKSQRDALLAAIEVKLLVEAQNGPG